MSMSNLQWKYENGEVIDERGEVVAMALREHTCRIRPVDRDRNMKLCAMAPALLALAEAVDQHLGLDDLSGFTDEQQQVILLASMFVRKAGAF